MGPEYRVPSQESGVYIYYDVNISDGRLIQVQGSHSTAPSAEFQQQLPSRQETISLTGRDNLSFVPDATRTWTAEERNVVVVEQDSLDLTGSNFQQLELQFGELQGQPESHQEYHFDPFLTGSHESPYAPYTQAPLLDANRPWTAEERNNMALWINFNADCNANISDQQSIQQESRQENLLRPGSGVDLPSTSYTSEQIPIIDATRSWTAEGRNDVNFEQDSSLNQDCTSFKFQRQFQFPFGENGHSQPANSRGLSRSLIPPSGAAGLPTGTSSTTTASSVQSPVAMESSAAWPHLTTEDDPRTVGSPRIQQAAARRRKKDAIHQCPADNCSAIFTESHNLEYHLNAHRGLKPYGCQQCPYAAASPGTLKRHGRLRHQKVQVKP